MNPRRISFARSLPLLAFLLSYIIAAVPATMTYIGLRHISRHGRVIPLVSLGLWFILFSVFAALWLRRRLRWQRTRASLQARLTAELQ